MSKLCMASSAVVVPSCGLGLRSPALSLASCLGLLLTLSGLLVISVDNQNQLYSNIT